MGFRLGGPLSVGVTHPRPTLRAARGDSPRSPLDASARAAPPTDRLGLTRDDPQPMSWASSRVTRVLSGTTHSGALNTRLEEEWRAEDILNIPGSIVLPVDVSLTCDPNVSTSSFYLPQGSRPEVTQGKYSRSTRHPKASLPRTPSHVRFSTQQ